MAIKHYKLTAEQSARHNGKTDLFICKYTDLTATADNTADTLTLDALAIGDIVFQDAVIEVLEAWSGPADLTGTASVGVTGTATALTPALTICTAGTGAAKGVADTSDEQTNAHYVAAAAINLILTVTPDADSGNDEYTSGKLAVWLNISRAATRQAAALGY